MWLKLAKRDQKWSFFECIRSKTVSGCVPRHEKRENSNKKSLKIGQFLPILATFYEFKITF
jgi:hypothetical protein